MLKIINLTCVLVFFVLRTLADNNLEEKIQSEYSVRNYSAVIELFENDNNPQLTPNAVFHVCKSFIYLKSPGKSKLLLKKEKSKFFNSGSYYTALYYDILFSYYREVNLYDSAITMNKKLRSFIPKIKIESKQSEIKLKYYYNAYNLALYQQSPKTNLYKDSVETHLDPKDYLMLDFLSLQAASAASDPESGLELIDKAIKLREELFPTDTISFIDLYLQKAFLHYSNGDINLSIKLFENDVKPILFKDYKNNSRQFDFQKCEFYRLALFPYKYSGNYEKTIRYSNEFLTNAKQFYVKDHFRYGEVYRELAENYLALGNVNKYLENIDIAIRILDKKESYRLDNAFYRSKSSFMKNDYIKCIYEANKYIDLAGENIESYDYSRVVFMKIISLFQLGEVDSTYRYLQKMENFLIKKSIDNIQYITYFKLLFLSLIENSEIDLNGEYNINVDKIYQSIDSYLIQKFDSSKFNVSSEYLLLLTKHRLKENIINDSTVNLIEKLELNIQSFLDKSNLKEFNADQLRFLQHFYNVRALYHEARLKDNIQIETVHEIVANCFNANKYKSLIVENVNEYNDILSLRNQVQEEDYMSRILSAVSAINSDSLPASTINLVIKSIELTRSSLLTKSLKLRNSIKSSELSDSLAYQEEYLKQQISYLKRNIPGYSNTSSLRSELETQLTIVEQKLNLLYLKVGYSPLPSNVNNEINVSYNELISSILNQDILVYYYTGQNQHNTFVIAISPTRTKILKLDQLPNSIVQQFRASLKPTSDNTNNVKSYRNYVQSAYAIYQSQLKPILDHFQEAKKIYVIPDGQLHHIPFEALVSKLPQNDITNYDQLRYLIQDYTFSYANSGTTLFKTKSLLKRLKQSDNRVLAFAPSYNTKKRNESLVAQRSDKKPLSTIRGELTDLRFNNEEVNAISDYFDGKSFTKELAFEQSFKDNAADYDVLHLSMHAIVDQQDPMYSYLAFAPNPLDSSTGDGYLHAFEIYDMNLNAEMAVLSACNTGYGKVYKGEGPMSLAKAFTYAGCPSVVMSYWPADDQASSDIMKVFYANLAEGLNKDEALRNAKLTYFKSAPPFKKSPAYWNNFVVMGDVSPLVKDHTRLYAYIGVGLLLLILLVWVVVKLKKTSFLGNR